MPQRRCYDRAYADDLAGASSMPQAALRKATEVFILHNWCFQSMIRNIRILLYELTVRDTDEELNEAIDESTIGCLRI